MLAFAQNTTYTVDKESSGKTGINWALDQRWGGSGGFQFGSTAKAFALVTAMESGMTLQASVNAKAAGNGHMAAYQPKDFPGGCGPGSTWDVDNDTFWPGGSISLMKATALSTNTAFVALAQQLGGCKVRDTMLRLGLHQSDGQPVGKYAPQYILGASDVSPQGVAQAYGVLAADGKKCSMIAVTKVTQGSKVLAEPKTTCTQVVDPDVVHATDKFLEYNMTNGSGIRNQLDGGARPSAGKTGTANNNNESWFVGYTPQLATAVWVGTPYDPISRVMKNVTVGGTFYPVMHGAAIAAPIWKGIMNGALQGQPIVPFTEPSAKFSQGTGTPPGVIPSVTGLSVAEAISTLQAAGYPAGVGGTMGSSVPSGLVAGTSPYGSAPSGTFVTIYTSRGGGGQQPQPQTPPAPSRPSPLRQPRPRRWWRWQTGQARRARASRPRRPAADPVTTKARRDPRRAFVVVRCFSVRRQPARTRRTMPATRPPSARPATAASAAFIARPICGIPLAPEAVTASRTIVSSSSSPSCFGR